MDGKSGLRQALTDHFDAIVLDLGLPRLDGTQLCRQLRSAGRSTPVIMLTGRADLDDRIGGLEIGADDYLVKPVALRELEARLRAQDRRARGGLDGRVLAVEDLELDERGVRVTRAGQPILLARLDFELLKILMRASPAVVTRARLEHELWGDQPPRSDALRNHIHVLRRLVDRPFGVPLLQTVHGIGYRLAAPE